MPTPLTVTLIAPVAHHWAFTVVASATQDAPRCEEEPSSYAASDECTYGQQYWADKVSLLIAEHATSGMPSSASCQGGVWETDRASAGVEYTYDCGSECGQSSSRLGSCCAACEEEKKRTTGRRVHCAGCDGQTTAGLLSTDTCALGKPSAPQASWVCQVLPCDSCTDETLKAECCKVCLQSRCHGGDRKWCQGCEATPPARQFPLVLRQLEAENETSPSAAPVVMTPAPAPDSIWTKILTIVTCIGIVVTLCTLILLIRLHLNHHYESGSSSDEEKLVPVAVTIMPPQAQQQYQVHPTSWQAWEPGSMRNQGGMPLQGVGTNAHLS